MCNESRKPSEKPRNGASISLSPLSFEEAIRGLLETDPKAVQEGMDKLRREQGTRRPRKRKTVEDSKNAAPSE